MKRIFLALAAVTLMAGCTKSSSVGCAVQDAAGSLLSATVATQLSCKKLDAVKASIMAELEKTKLCKEAEAAAAPVATAAVSTKSVIGDTICAPVVEGLTAGILAKIPAEWECSGGMPIEQLKTSLTEACQKAL